MEHVSSDHRLFVGNMTSQIGENELRKILVPYGPIKYIQLTRGFAFVEMADNCAAPRVIAGLNGKRVSGRCLKVRLGF